MKPMTKEEWDARQSVIRKVVDPETGRTRWAVLGTARPQTCSLGRRASGCCSKKAEGGRAVATRRWDFSMGLLGLVFPTVRSKQLQGGMDRRVLRELLLAVPMARPPPPPLSPSQGWGGGVGA